MWLRERSHPNERAFCDALEAWTGAHLPPSSEFSGRWWDGLLLDEVRVAEPSLVVSGEIWHINQHLHPFQAQLCRGEAGWVVDTVCFADARVPQGRPERGCVVIGTPRIWRFTLVGP